jgi:hypothetical protein
MPTQPSNLGQVILRHSRRSWLFDLTFGLFDTSGIGPNSTPAFFFREGVRLFK